VELARLQYLSTRLVRRWSHLERQPAASAPRGGPGETQIELDRRMIRAHQERRRRGWRRSSSNASRSGGRACVVAPSRFAGGLHQRRQVHAFQLARQGPSHADQLFATLDTTTPGSGLQQAQTSVSLSDTVGFIRDLPHELVEAFQATLSEAVDADLLSSCHGRVQSGSAGAEGRGGPCAAGRRCRQTCRRSWCATSWTGWSPRRAPANGMDVFEDRSGQGGDPCIRQRTGGYRPSRTCAPRLPPEQSPSAIESQTMSRCPMDSLPCML
jgi:hypothetical protein